MKPSWKYWKSSTSLSLSINVDIVPTVMMMIMTNISWMAQIKWIFTKQSLKICMCGLTKCGTFCRTNPHDLTICMNFHGTNPYNLTPNCTTFCRTIPHNPTSICRTQMGCRIFCRTVHSIFVICFVWQSTNTDFTLFVLELLVASAMAVGIVETCIGVEDTTTDLTTAPSQCLSNQLSNWIPEYTFFGWSSCWCKAECHFGWLNQVSWGQVGL